MLLSFCLALPLYTLYYRSVTKRQELSHGRHCVFAIYVNLVFVTQYRYRVFDGKAVESLRMIFAKVCTDFETTLVEMDGEDNPVHLLIQYPPKVSVSSLVNSLKGVSSRMLRQERPDLMKIGRASCKER